LSNVDLDAQFFADHPDRKAHIRAPRRQIYVDKQRATRFMDECEMEFRSLGDHDRDRRRILLCRTDAKGLPMSYQGKQAIFKLPMLLFSDETIEDRDDVLLPIIFELAANQVEHGSA
jgi:hypothetical protein